MQVDRWKSIAELFEKALIAPPSEREELLHRECGNDAELCEQVKRLLENERRAGDDFLVSASQSSKLHSLDVGGGSDRLIGQCVGSYSIKRFIASGGMGAVYLADQESPRREVALKIMTGGFWSRSAQRRFEFETEILGRLLHPNIAQVYESGIHRLDTGATVPYFAMEYVPAAKLITNYCDEHKLDIRERLKLFGVVCDAVHYGHQKGVVHRDLKPGNLLVDEHGHVKVIDFGVARSTDSDIAATTMHTEANQLIGTLAYMSPEQAGGPCGTGFQPVKGGAAAPPVPGSIGVPPVNRIDIDTRTDVYSLGVMLFELLTGRLPYDVSHMTIHAATRVICEQEPARPSTIKSCGTGFQPVKRSIGVSPVKLRGDLDTIILKCLEKDRARRYSSAAALADDIERHLRGEPIAARPPTRWTNAVRWVARRPVLATGLLCMLVAISTLCATTASVWYLSLRPDHVVRYRHGQPLAENEQGSPADEARLLARNGNVLHRWGGARHSIAFAELADRPPRFGGGRLAVIGYTNLETGPIAKLLCAYDVDGNLDEPHWHKRVEPKEVLKELVENSRFDARRFSARRALVADVFPGDEHPGNEIVAVFDTDRSPRIIRIYNLGGELLYEAWHDGALESPYWMEDAGLLLFGGDDQQRNWDKHGAPKSGERAPVILFALRPSPASIGRDDFLNSNGSLTQPRPGKRPTGLVWYKWLYQEGGKPANSLEYGPRITRPSVGDPGRCTAINVMHASGNYAVRWEIDEFGNKATEKSEPNENYKLAWKSGQPPLPDPDAFELTDRMPTFSPTTSDVEP